MKIGIDAIAFSTSRYFLSLETLAKHRSVDYAKYQIGIEQIKMAIFPPNEDIVTIAIDAAKKAVSKVENINDIDMLIFATESSFDLSKSTGIYVHHFLKLKEECRVFDLKQACYSVTAALRMAKSYIAENLNSKVLIVGSDIVKYSARTSGEPTQGGAAVAIVVSQNPRIMEIEPYYGVHTNNIMDFWRPSHMDEALFNGELSARNYLTSFDISVKRYMKKVDFSLLDIEYACFHAPFCKMAKKANDKLFKCKSIEKTLIYNSIIGNSCSASLYICLVSLLEHEKENLAGRRIGMFSYGSGSVAEFFSGIVSENYKQLLCSADNQDMLSSRLEIPFFEYELIYSGRLHEFDIYQNIGDVALTGIENNQRLYQNCPIRHEEEIFC